MNLNSVNNSSLICITRDDPRFNHFEQVQAFFDAGARLIQIRAKSTPLNDLSQQAKKAVKLTRGSNCQLLINDYFDLAKDIDADGVHLGSTDAPVEYVRKFLPSGKIIGKTVHSLNEAKSSILQKPDYIGLGPYRRSFTKKDLRPSLSDKDFIAILDILSPIPVFFIGGLTGKDFCLIDRFKIQGIALCSELFTKSAGKPQVDSLVQTSKSFEMVMPIQ